MKSNKYNNQYFGLKDRLVCKRTSAWLLLMSIFLLHLPLCEGEGSRYLVSKMLHFHNTHAHTHTHTHTHRKRERERERERKREKREREREKERERK